MNLSISFRPLLLISWLFMFSFSDLAAQEVINPSFQVYHLGTLDGERVIYLPQSPEFEQWITDHAQHSMIDESSVPENYTSSIVLDPRSGWNYVAGWNQGSSEILIRFQLVTAGEKLNLLEVGAFQTCVCQGCSDLQFSKEIPACECEGGDCLYLMGEYLH